ncbi:MAG TPA: DUF2946 family protein [Brevundimonas sp.]
MTRSQADDWSIARSLAFLAATFAIVFGSLMPFAALAASTPGDPMVICSAEGPQTISIGVDGADHDKSPSRGMAGAKCAACLLSFAAALPEPPLALKAAGPITRPASIFIAAGPRVSPPARAPPRPPSTAPPKA